MRLFLYFIYIFALSANIGCTRCKIMKQVSSILLVCVEFALKREYWLFKVCLRGN